MKLLLIIAAVLTSTAAHAQTYFQKEVITKMGYTKDVTRTIFEVGKIGVDTTQEPNHFFIDPSRGRKKVLIVPKISHNEGTYTVTAIDKSGRVKMDLNGARFRIEDSKRIVIYHFKMLM